MYINHVIQSKMYMSNGKVQRVMSFLFSPFLVKSLTCKTLCPFLSNCWCLKLQQIVLWAAQPAISPRAPSSAGEDILTKTQVTTHHLMAT